MSKVKIHNFAVAAVFLLTFSVAHALNFWFLHPHGTVTMPDATHCVVYEIGPGVAGPNALPGEVGEHIDPLFQTNYDIIQGPITCNASEFKQLQQLLADPWTYGRNNPDILMTFGGWQYFPSYAYKMYGPSGSMVVLIDPRYGRFLIHKFDGQGHLVSDSRVWESDGRWSSLLKKAFAAVPDQIDQ